MPPTRSTPPTGAWPATRRSRSPRRSYLGHYVAGKLAARHGIDVRLEPTPGTGITAVVGIPPSLFEATPVPVPTVPSTHPIGGHQAGASGAR